MQVMQVFDLSPNNTISYSFESTLYSTTNYSINRSTNYARSPVIKKPCQEQTLELCFKLELDDEDLARFNLE
jgi:hypothetical protein